MRVLLLTLLIALVAPLSWAYEQEGVASWYGGKFQGRKTANGEIFDTYQLTAAHPSLPFGSIVKVTNLDNGKQVTVRINDRGPFAKGRVLDVSLAAARILDMEHKGTAHIKLSTDAKELTANLNPLVQIQVGAYRNIKNAARLKQLLADNGFEPYAVMNAEGVVRIELRNVTKQDANQILSKLKALGVENPLVKA